MPCNHVTNAAMTKTLGCVEVPSVKVQLSGVTVERRQEFILIINLDQKELSECYRCCYNDVSLLSQ